MSASFNAVGNDLSKNNSSGFAGLPGGNVYVSSGFFGQNGGWWGSTTSSTFGTVGKLGNQDVGFFLSADYKTAGHSIRLIKQ